MNKRYTIQLPDGRTMTAEAPDEATALKGAQDWFAANSKPDLSKLSDDELRRLAGQQPAQRSIRDMSDDELRALAKRGVGTKDATSRAVPQIGETWTDPETGEARRVVDPMSIRQPGEMTPADIEGRMKVLAPRGPRALPQAPSGLGPTQLEPFDPVASAQAARDPIFTNRALANVAPDQRDLARTVIGAQRASDRTALETGAREAVNAFGMGLPRLLSSAFTGGPVTFADEHAIQLAADAKGAQMSPRAAQAGAVVGSLAQALALPGGAVATPARAATTGAALSATPTLVETGDLGQAVRDGITGAVVGGAARGATYTPKPGAPTRDALKAAAKKGYEELDQMGVRYSDPAYSRLASGITQRLSTEGLDPQLHPKVTRMQERMQSRQGGALLDDLRADRRLLADIATTPDENRLASIMRREVDNFIDRADPGDMVTGDAKKAAALLREANGNYAAAQRSSTLEEALARARRSSERTGQSTDAATRGRLASILNSGKAMRAFDEAETTALEAAVKGTAATNLARAIGRFGPQNTLTTVAALGGGAVTANPLALAVPAMGYLGRKLAERGTRKAVERIDAMTRMRSPLGQALQREAIDPNDAHKRAVARLIMGMTANGQ